MLERKKSIKTFDLKLIKTHNMRLTSYTINEEYRRRQRIIIEIQEYYILVSKKKTYHNPSQSVRDPNFTIKQSATLVNHSITSLQEGASKYKPN